MFGRLIDALEDAMQGLADLLSSFIDKVAQVAQDFMFGYMEWVMNGMMDAMVNLGVPQSARVELDCGGHVEIDYYVRRPG